MLRKFVTTLTILVLVIGTVLPLQAYGDTDIGYEGRVCRDLGILKGNTGVVDNAYLETHPSRLQAAIMFLRLKGLEQDALSYTGRSNFKDTDAVAWKEGRNVLSYLRNHPEYGWIGDGINFLPYNPISSKEYYKVLLESLGYKQKIDREGDFEWNSVIDFAAGKGLKKVADVNSFTVRSLAIATVEALNSKVKNSEKKLIERLVENGDVDKGDAISLGLYSKGMEATVEAVRAISNSKVEVAFEEAVDGSEAIDEDLYSIKQLEIKKVNVKNSSTVIIDTSAMSESTTYILNFNDENFSFKGMKKDSNAPKLITAECKDTNLVELSFDRILDNQTAQDTDTYSIEGVAINSAALDTTNTKVRIVTSGIETGRSYELKIHNIKNGDGVITKLITKRFTGRKDTNPPKLNKLTVLNNTKLLLEFSDVNGLDKASAQDTDNYNITSSSGDLDIVSVQVKDNDDDGLWESVELTTESQSVSKAYTLRIENISDDSVLGNKITKEIKKDFRGKAKDTSAPTVDHNPKAITSSIIEIVFKDANALDLESACDPDNYELDGDLEIKEVRIKNPSDLYSMGGKTIHLITSEMDKSEYYTLIIKEISDEFGNELKSSTSYGYKKYKFRGVADDNVPPYITFVECIDSKTIEIKFDNLLDEDSAEKIANYRIDGLALVTKAALQEDERTVRLTVSSLSSDKNHTILMSNIKDISGNSLSNISVSVVYNGNVNDTDAPEADYIEAMNEDEIWVHFDEEVNAQSAQLKASGLTFDQVGKVLDNGTTVVMKATRKMDNVEYEVTSLTGIRDLRNNSYKFEDNLDFYGTDMDNDPPEVDDWQQLDVKRFRVIFSEPVIATGVSGIKNPSGVSLSWSVKLNPKGEETNEAYSTVDYIAEKDIPMNKEFRFNFSSMITDYVGKEAFDEEDDDGESGVTVLETYMEDDEEPFIEYVEAITRTKAQVVFNEAIDESHPGTYKITYRDDDDNLKTIRISRVEVDSNDDIRVNILTEDEMSQEYAYTLVPVTAASDIAGNRLDTDDLEIDFEGSNIRSSDYIQGVEFIDDDTFKVTKSSKIYNKVAALYELDEDGDTIGSNLLASDSVRISDNVHRVTSKKPLLRDVRYRVTVDGLEYRFYGGLQNGYIELNTENREITFNGMDVGEYNVEISRADGDELDVDEQHEDFVIDASERLGNGELVYVYVKRESDGAIVYGTRIRIEGMPAASSSKEIISFGFANLYPAVSGTINDSSGIITLRVPFGTDVKKLAAGFTCSSNAVVKVGTNIQVTGVTENDFSKEVTYTIIAEDGSVRNYGVVVTIEESKLEKEIKSFVLKDFNPYVTGIIDNANHMISLDLPNGTELKVMKPTIETSYETTVSPASEIEIDLDSSDPVYKVTAKDGSTQEYTININENLSSENSIKYFKLEGAKAYETNILTGAQNTITIKVPYDIVTTKLTAIITISDNAEITPKSPDENDFSKPVTYKVTAQDGKVREYTVTVERDPSPEKLITGFSLVGFSSEDKVKINNETFTIDAAVPYGTDLTQLKAAFTSSDKSIVKVGDKEQVSRETENNFTKPVVYTVIAENKTIQSYTVTVDVEALGEKKMTGFSFKIGDTIVKASIDEAKHEIIAAVPSGTNISELVANFSYIGKSISIADIQQISGKTVNDFRSPVIYTITAPDGTTIEYTVIVNI